MRIIPNPGPFRGASASRNAGLAAAEGEYVIFLDSDDILAPTCIERRLEIMQRNPELDFAAFPTWMFHEVPGDSTILYTFYDDEDDLDRFLRQHAPWMTMGPIWRKQSLCKAGLMWNPRAKSWQDFDFHTRALARGLKYVKVREPDSFCRATRPGSISHKSQSSHSRRYAVNRVRLFRQAAQYVRAQGALTKRRQHLLAIQFLYHAFLSGLSWRKALKIWCVAREENLVGPLQFSAVLMTQLMLRVAGRVNRWCERKLFPELQSTASRMHLPATEPDVPRKDDDENPVEVQQRSLK